MTKKLENVRVESLAQFGGNLGVRAAACFEMEGARYHIWFDTATGEREDVLYKNPLRSVGRHDPGHFETRSLDAANKANAPIVAALFAEIEERKLVEAALAAEAEKAAQKQAERAAAHRLHLKQQAGPALFDLLKMLADAADTVNNLQHAGAPIPAEVWAELYEATQAARTALHLQQGRVDR
jgi:hypothetical protein